MPSRKISHSQPASIPVSYVRWVSRALNLNSSELPELLKHSGLVPGNMTDETILLSTGQQATILENAIHISGDEDFSLRLGQILTPAAHGPLGYLALSSPDVQSAMEGFVQFLPTRIPVVHVNIETRKDDVVAYLEIDALMSEEDYRHLVETCVVSLQSMVECILGRPVTEAYGEFSYDKPGYDYSRYLHFPISFSAPATRFTIPSSLARTPNVSPDHDNYAFALQQCQIKLRELQNQPQTTAQKVRSLMLSHPAGHLTEEQIAAELFITKRTLARRLQREKSSFRQLRDEHLAALAKNYLDDTDLSVETIATLLDYHDSANFRRAFKRWFNKTPQQYRQSRL
jgi:AraC-like DNA-binding protein